MTIVALCSEKGRYFTGNERIMKQSTYDISSRIELARRQRSDALGLLMVAGWSQLRKGLSRLLLRRNPSSFPWIETPA